VIVIISSSGITASAFTGKPLRSHTEITIIQGLSYLFIALICIDNLSKYIHKSANKKPYTLKEFQRAISTIGHILYELAYSQHAVFLAQNYCVKTESY